MRRTAATAAATARPTHTTMIHALRAIIGRNAPGFESHALCVRQSHHSLRPAIRRPVPRVLARRQGTELAVRDDQLGLGVHVGYRIALPASFYVTPWIGVGYQLGTRDVTLDGKTYAPSTITVFPAIHLGYQFR